MGDSIAVIAKAAVVLEYKGTAKVALSDGMNDIFPVDQSYIAFPYLFSERKDRGMEFLPHINWKLPQASKYSCGFAFGPTYYSDTNEQ